MPSPKPKAIAAPTQQTSTRSPSGDFRPFLTGQGLTEPQAALLPRIFAESQREIEPLPPGSERIAPLPTQTQVGVNQLFGRGLAGDPSVNSGRSFLTGLLGTDATNNPIVNAAVNRAQGDVVDQFNLQTAPALAAASRFSGSKDNTGLQEIGAFSRFNTERALGDVRANATNAFLQNQLTGANLAPAFGNASLQDIGAILQSGDILQQQDQRIRDADVARLLDERNIPREQVGFFADALNAAGLQNFGTTTGSGFNTQITQPPNDVLGGISAAAGIAGIVALAFMCSRNFKEDIQPAERVLDKLSGLEIKTWRYNPRMMLGTDRHIGPIAEDFQEAFGVGDGRTIQAIDMFGVLLGGLKELSEKVSALSRRIQRTMLPIPENTV